MGRGIDKNRRAVPKLVGRYDLMPDASGEMLSGKPWSAHVSQVKAARLAMLDLLTSTPNGLITDDLRASAIDRGAASDEVATAQVQLIRQNVIVKDPLDETWHLSDDAQLVAEWRELSAA